MRRQAPSNGRASSLQSNKNEARRVSYSSRVTSSSGQLAIQISLSPWTRKKANGRRTEELALCSANSRCVPRISAMLEQRIIDAKVLLDLIELNFQPTPRSRNNQVSRE